MAGLIVVALFVFNLRVVIADLGLGSCDRFECLIFSFVERIQFLR